MEFVLLGALGVIGYWTNSNKTVIPKQKRNLTAKDLENEFNQNVADHLIKNPNVVISGQTDITNNTVPFFTSAKNQNTNSDFKDRRLETFTGVNNVDYTPKTEHKATPPVKGLTNIHGTTFTPDMERYNGYTTNMLQNNVTPVEKQYVGPGLGIPPEQNSSGGFHQRFRVMPDNVNGYRKNTFGGDIIVGKSHIDNRDTTSEQQSTRSIENTHLTPNELNSIGNRPLEAAHGYIQAPTIYSDSQASLSVGNRSNEMSMCLGGPLTTGQGAPGPYQQSQMTTRTSEHVYPKCVVGGQHRPGVAGGGYQTAQYLMPTNTDRETENCHRLNVGGNSFGAYQSQQSTLKTQRGNNELCPEQQFGAANSSSQGMFFPSRQGWDAPVTQKELTSCPDYRVGIAGSGIAQGSQVGQQNGDSIRPTLRGQSNSSSGPAGSYISSATTHNTNHASHASRELATVMNYTPNVQHTSNLMLGAEQLQHTITTQKNDQNSNRIVSNAQGLGVQNFTDRSNMGRVTTDSQTVKNNRDFGYTPKNELRTNILKQM